MKLRIPYFLIPMLLFALGGCDKPGKGGRATVHVHVFNDARIIPYANVQVRYGGTGFPGTGAQYQETKLADYSGQADFDKLRKGDYYFYVSTLDSTSPTFELLEGGAQVDIDNRNGERHVVVDLGEEDPF
jgi:hypothetical protein